VALSYATAKTSFIRLAWTRASRALGEFRSIYDRLEVRASCFSVLAACLPVADCKVLPPTGQNNNSLDNPTSALASTPAPTNKPTHTPKPTTVKFASTIEQANSPPAQHEPAKSLISPPPTPRKAHSPQPLRSPSPTATMERAPLHGAPPHGRVPPHRASARPSPPAYGNQDARGNFAVPPAASAGGSGSFKLKKAAVRIVGAAPPAPPPSTPHRVAAPAPATAASSPAPGSVKAKAKEPERYVVSSALCSRHCVAPSSA
jgi:hypothetical protein